MLGACLGLYAFSGSVIVQFYLMGLIKTVVSASLVAVLITLLLILSGLTLLVDHASITDCSLLALYLTYNLWIIARTRASDISIRSLGSAAAARGRLGGGSGVVDFFLAYTTSWTDHLRGSSSSSSSSLSGILSAALSMFSVEIVASLLIQMSIFLLLARLYRQARSSSEAEAGESASSSAQGGGAIQWILAVLWPCYGKCLLVAMYTYSWLTFTSQAVLPIGLDPVMWRWVGMFGCILLYVRHLLNPPGEEDYYYNIKCD